MKYLILSLIIGITAFTLGRIYEKNMQASLSLGEISLGLMTLDKQVQENIDLNKDIISNLQK